MNGFVVHTCIHIYVYTHIIHAWVYILTNLLYCLLFLLYLLAILYYFPLLYALCYRFVLLGASVAAAFSLMRLPNVTHTRPYTHIYTRAGTYMHIHLHMHRYIFVYVRLNSYIQGEGAGEGVWFVCLLHDILTSLNSFSDALPYLGRGEISHTGRDVF